MRTIFFGLILVGLGAGAIAQVSPEEHAAHHPAQAAPAQATPDTKHPVERCNCMD
jgi:hypothetical protein